MISLRESVKIIPDHSSIISSGMLFKKWIASVPAKIKKFYLHLPVVYIHVTVVTVTLLLSLGVGLITPWWVI